VHHNDGILISPVEELFEDIRVAEGEPPLSHSPSEIFLPSGVSRTVVAVLHPKHFLPGPSRQFYQPLDELEGLFLLPSSIGSIGLYECPAVDTSPILNPSQRSGATSRIFRAVSKVILGPSGS